MQRAIISDTSCLIILQNIHELGLLNKLFGSIITTPEVFYEFGFDLPEWIQIIEVLDKKFQKQAETSVDKGEASAIALAREIGNCLLIIDDLKARNYALSLGYILRVH